MMVIFSADDIKIEQRPVVTGLPKNIVVAYYGLMPCVDATWFVILQPYSYGRHDVYEGWACLIGREDKLKPVPIEGITRARDGGTTYITIKDGVFCFPTPFKPELPGTYNDLPLKAFYRGADLTPMKR